MWRLRAAVLCVRTDRAVCLPLLFCSVHIQTYWHSVAQVNTIHTHGFFAFLLIYASLSSDWNSSTDALPSHEDYSKSASLQMLQKFSHFLILLKSGNQYRIKCMRNVLLLCACTSKCMKNENLKNEVMKWDNLSCVWTFSSLCNSYEFFFCGFKLSFKISVWIYSCLCSILCVIKGQ